MKINTNLTVRFRRLDRLRRVMDDPTDSVHSIGPPTASVPFVGREREVGLLQRALDETLAGSGRLLLLVGEPGIGKTRLAEQLGDEARDRGARVLWGGCYEWEGAPAYWPWLQALRALEHEASIIEVLDRFGDGRGSLIRSFLSPVL